MSRRAFLPLSGLHSGEILVGWRLAPDVLCVAGSCPPEGVEGLFAVIKSSKLEVLGRCLAAEEDQAAPGPSSELVLRLDTQGRTISSGAETVLYTPPDSTRLRYLSLAPIDLASARASGDQRALSKKVDDLARAWDSRVPLSDIASGGDDGSAAKGTSVGKGKGKGKEGEEPALEDVLERINAASRVQAAATRLRRGGSSSSMQAGERDPPRDARRSTAFRAWSSASRLVGEASDVLESRIGRLARASLTYAQLQTRLRQLAGMPEAWLRTRASGEQGIHARNQAYIDFYNTVWLIANDVIVGLTISALLRDNSAVVSARIDRAVQQYAVDAVRHGLLWLDDWPVGLKLNTPLSRLYCDVLGDLTAYCGGWMARGAFCLPVVLRGVALLSRLGGTFAICLALDGLHVVTAHLALAYACVAGMYRWEMSNLYALWNLFRGKRWNALRDRVDSYDYDLDQLFLGTLLFTVSLFLLPTVLTYYLFFVMIRCVMLALQAACEVSLALLNTFPLFAVMLRVKEPSRIPGGVRFDISSDATGSRVEIKNQPISFRQIFARFGESWAVLTATYGPSRVFRGIAGGRL